MNIDISNAAKNISKWRPFGRGRARFAFCFLLNEVDDLSFFFDIILFSYSFSLCCKKFYKNLQKKSYSEKCIRGHHSRTQNCLLEITHPRNICSQCVFMTCACSIKQTLNYSFSTIQYTCCVISRITSKRCFLFLRNGSVKR